MRRDYNKEKRFVKILADAVGVEEGGSRAGIITFSYDAELSVDLSDFRDTSKFKAIVYKLPFMGYTTRIDKALMLAKEKLFKVSVNSRPKIMFLLTDGRQTADPDAVDPGIVASEIRTLFDVKIFVIGIGRRVNPSELAHIAGDTANVFLAKGFPQLTSVPFVKKVAGMFCTSGACLAILL